MDAVFFRWPAELSAWLDVHQDTAAELWIGFYKKDAGETGITYAEAVDVALCYGWIDGIRKRIDDRRFTNRFTRRTPRSNWSQVNIKRVGELSALGLMQPAGLRAFENRDAARSNLYSYEEKDRPLDAVYEAPFRANPAAWAFFQAQAPYYQRVAKRWIMSAKREETRQKRLATLIAESAAGRRLAVLTGSAKQ